MMEDFQFYKNSAIYQVCSPNDIKGKMKRFPKQQMTAFIKAFGLCPMFDLQTDPLNYKSLIQICLDNNLLKTGYMLMSYL